MSVELLIVFALNAPPSGVSLQAALDRESNPVHISEAKELFDSYPKARAFQKPISAVVSFQVGGNPLECVAAARVASALARDFRASVFDPQGGDFMTAETLKTIVLACEDEVRSKGPALRSPSPKQ